MGHVTGTSLNQGSISDRHESYDEYNEIKTGFLMMGCCMDLTSTEEDAENEWARRSKSDWTSRISVPCVIDGGSQEEDMTFVIGLSATFKDKKKTWMDKVVERHTMINDERCTSFWENTMCSSGVLRCRLSCQDFVSHNGSETTTNEVRQDTSRKDVSLFMFFQSSVIWVETTSWKWQWLRSLYHGIKWYFLRNDGLMWECDVQRHKSSRQWKLWWILHRLKDAEIWSTR